MIKSFVKIFSVISKPSSKFIVNNFKTKNMNHFYSFCSSVKPTSGEILVKDNPDVKVST